MSHTHLHTIEANSTSFAQHPLFLRPDTHVTPVWSQYAHTNIDDPIRAFDKGDEDKFARCTSSADINKTQEWVFQNPNGVTSITGFKLHMLNVTDTLPAQNEISAVITIDGVPQAPLTDSPIETLLWRIGPSISGLWSVEQAAAIRLAIRSPVTWSLAGPAIIDVHAVYLELLRPSLNLPSILRPDGNETSNWPIGQFDRIDEIVEDPQQGNGFPDLVAADIGQSGVPETWTLDPPPVNETRPVLSANMKVAFVSDGFTLSGFITVKGVPQPTQVWAVKKSSLVPEYATINFPAPVGGWKVGDFDDATVTIIAPTLEVGENMFGDVLYLELNHPPAFVPQFGTNRCVPRYQMRAGIRDRYDASVKISKRYPGAERIVPSSEDI